MSLNDNPAGALKAPLRSADQYHIWKARITASCWSVAKKNIFNITDKQCDEAVDSFNKEEVKGSDADWVGKSWLLITSTLHDDLFMKVAHIKHGHIASLLAEIRAALLVNIAEDIQPLRLELYGATMANTGDLQAFIRSCHT